MTGNSATGFKWSERLVTNNNCHSSCTIVNLFLTIENVDVGSKLVNVVQLKLNGLLSMWLAVDASVFYSL